MTKFVGGTPISDCFHDESRNVRLLLLLTFCIELIKFCFKQIGEFWTVYLCSMNE